ncbi:MAG: hypothetical protein J5I59_05625 [Saprospiraceae bacterium]|nr:hypothetical protein [Saprospiraceae bacterium]
MTDHLNLPLEEVLAFDPQSNDLLDYSGINGYLKVGKQYDKLLLKRIDCRDTLIRLIGDTTMVTLYPKMELNEVIIKTNEIDQDKRLIQLLKNNKLRSKSPDLMLCYNATSSYGCGEDKESASYILSVAQKDFYLGRFRDMRYCSVVYDTLPSPRDYPWMEKAGANRLKIAYFLDPLIMGIEGNRSQLKLIVTDTALCFIFKVSHRNKHSLNCIVEFDRSEHIRFIEFYGFSGEFKLFGMESNFFYRRHDYEGLEGVIVLSGLKLEERIKYSESKDIVYTASMSRISPCHPCYSGDVTQANFRSEIRINKNRAKKRGKKVKDD